MTPKRPLPPAGCPLGEEVEPMQARERSWVDEVFASVWGRISAGVIVGLIGAVVGGIFAAGSLDAAVRSGQDDQLRLEVRVGRVEDTLTAVRLSLARIESRMTLVPTPGLAPEGMDRDD